MNLSLWLSAQGLSVRELARRLELPPTTVEDWVYKAAVPSRENAERLNDLIANYCAHHWVIDRPNGPLSEGLCQRCGERREFSNSIDSVPWPISQRSRAQQFHMLNGFTSTRIFCRPNCPPGRRTKPEHRFKFEDSDKAFAAGYRPCYVCKPLDGPPGSWRPKHARR